jgi:hypothetical protein
VTRDVKLMTALVVGAVLLLAIVQGVAVPTLRLATQFTQRRRGAFPLRWRCFFQCAKS